MGRKTRIILGVIIGCHLFFVSSVRCNDILPHGEKLKITSPRNGEVFYPGQKITVKAEYLGKSSDIDGVNFLTQNMNGDFKHNPPYEYEFTINKEFLGKMFITAFAYILPIPAKDMVQDHVEVMVKTKEIPVKIEILPPFFEFLHPGEEIILDVMGTYPDGIERDITAFDTGTTYSSSDPSIFEVS